MTFDPADLYRFASWLYSQTPVVAHPALCRSIVSRAYYAALIAARESAKLTVSGGNSHKMIIDHYKTQSQLEAITVGNRLADLKLSREKSDYELGSDIGNREAGISLRKSREVLLQLGAISADEGEIRFLK